MVTSILLTASKSLIIGPIAKLFGAIMNGIFNIGITNVGVDILLLAFIVYMLTLPLTIKQQKFTKMSALMNPEIQAVQAKYKGKNDPESQTRMQAETRAIYDKYGSSPTSGCLPLIIQLPILWALYRVIYNVPAYVTSIFNIYRDTGIIEKVKQIPANEIIDFAKTLKLNINEVNDNTIVDVLWKLQENSWATLQGMGKNITGFVDSCKETIIQIKQYTMFCGISIAESPLNMLKAAFADKDFLHILIAVAIPVLAGVTQWLNVKLTTSASKTDSASGNEIAERMQQSMKSMNIMMPLMSVFICFSLPSGIGIYWIFGAVFRGIQQIIINRALKDMDMEAEIAKNKAKAEEKKKRRGVYGNDAAIQSRAHTSTKNIQTSATTGNSGSVSASDITSNGTRNPKPGSLASKANMVRNYNERNKK